MQPSVNDIPIEPSHPSTLDEHVVQGLTAFIEKLTAENSEESEELYNALVKSSCVMGFLIKSLSNSICQVISHAINDEAAAKAIESNIMNHWINNLLALFAAEQLH